MTLELARWIALALFVAGAVGVLAEMIRICDKQKRRRR
jgi:hypothetical protein